MYIALHANNKNSNLEAQRSFGHGKLNCSFHGAPFWYSWLRKVRTRRAAIYNLFRDHQHVSKGVKSVTRVSLLGTEWMCNVAPKSPSRS